MKKINVVMFRGLAGAVYSSGLDSLAVKLRNEPGVDYVAVFSYTEWRSAAEIIKRWRDTTVFGPSHSYGVAAMFGTARASGISFPLAMSVDPSQWWRMSLSLWGSGGNSVPRNIRSAVNLYQSNGLIGRQTIAREDGSSEGVLNIPLLGTSHVEIDDDPRVHSTALVEIRRVIESINRPLVS